MPPATPPTTQLWNRIDPHAPYLIGGVIGVLVVASMIGFALKRTARSESAKRTIDNLNARTKAWWIMTGVFAAALAGGPAGIIILFALVSFQALRETITLTPTRRGDHHTLFWAFFVIIPIHYYLLYIRWYGLFAVFIPVYCFLFLAIRSALAGDYTRYLERTAKTQWGVMICVYCLSHAPALLLLEIPGYAQTWKLLVYLVIVVQMSDVLQYVWGKLLGRRKIAPHLSPNKTWEGFLGGAITATALGTVLWRITPFEWWQSAILSFVICMMGFFGGLVMSAIKRDAGVKDYGHLIEGHGGAMDRVDSLSFAAPVFFHVVRYYWSAA
jgi:phosphatidate cytidylyltransferase